MEADETLGAHKILIIDDNEDIADSLASVLARGGATAWAAYGGQAGLEAFERFKPEVVFLDLGMPEMDGYETARRIRELPEGRSVRLIAHTAWSRDAVEERSRAAGFDEHLAKPASYQSLCGVLWCKDDCAATAQSCLILAKRLGLRR
ncbi:MAG: response regulator [Methylocystis sp.]|uniref:response regulator n=1 Tax=Methylocystis sp. TaxID=1911079 RepID=UPI003DA43F62